MSNRTPLPELSDEQAAQANQGIEQFAEFMRDVLRQPEIVNEIPSGSTLIFRFSSPLGFISDAQPWDQKAQLPEHGEYAH